MRRPRRNKRQRTPFGVTSLKLDIDTETKERLKAEGKVPVWINDVDDRLESAQRGDYEFVYAKEVGGEEQSKTDAQNRRVGTTKWGEPTYAYLMAIREDFYAEDQAEKEERNKQVDASIKGGTSSGSPGVDESLGSAGVKKVSYEP